MKTHEYIYITIEVTPKEKFDPKVSAAIMSQSDCRVHLNSGKLGKIRPEGLAVVNKIKIPIH